MRGGQNSDLRIDFIARRLAGSAAPPRGACGRPDVARQAERFYQSHPDLAAQLLTVGESKADPSLEPATLAAWTMLANELMNLDEFLNNIG